MIRLAALPLVATLALASALSAQATVLVDPLDAAYGDMRILRDAGLVDGFSMTQRPMSRAAFAHALADATREISNRNNQTQQQSSLEFYRTLIASLRERLRIADSVTEHSRLAPLVAPVRTASIDLTQTDQPTRRIPVDNGLGAIDAYLNTLLTMRQGRPLVDGTSTILETEHVFESSRVAFSFTPQLSYLDSTPGGGRLSARLQQLQLRFLMKNVALEIGREYLVWGQGGDIGLLNSNNSPPLNLVKLSSDEAFSLPWLLKVLGPTRLAIFFSDLGADQNFPHAYAIGYRATVVPLNALELGLSVYTKAGGKGGPPATNTARLIDLLPFLDASAYNNIFGVHGKFLFSDHYAGFDGRLLISPLQSSFYWEVLLNDFDVRRLESVLWEDAGHVFGLDLPPLTPNGRLRGSLEYHHTGIRYYEHEQFLSGQTVHHTLTGDPLGPDAQGAYANISWYASAQRRIGVQAALERRSNDQYVFIPEPNFGFRRIEKSPREWSARALVNAQLLPSRHRFGGLLQFGYERTKNFDFVNADNRNGLLGRAALQYRFQ